MKKRLYILGGGHAGSSAALSAARFKKDWNAEDIEIHVIDKNPYMTVKPRLYEYELNQVINPFSQFLPQAGVHYHQDEITSINRKPQRVAGKKGHYSYDALILAAGSTVESKWKAENVDSYEGARHLQKSWKSLITACKPSEIIKIVILGGGFTGIELAAEMPGNIRKYCQEIQKQLPKIEISLMGHGEIGAGLGENPKSEIQNALRQAGVLSISNAEIKKVEQQTVYYTQNGKETRKKFDLVINTLGQTPNSLASLLNLKKDNSGRIEVGSQLNIAPKSNLFVAGDMASVYVDRHNKALMTCQQGRPQGRYAGYNAVALLTGRKLLEYTQSHYVTCLDLGDYGALYTTDWDRKVRFQGKKAKKLKKHINRERIYPPMTGKAKDLYAAGAIQFKDVLETMTTSEFY